MVCGVVVVCGTHRSQMGCGRPWALNLHECRVVVINGGVVRSHSMWVGSGRLWVHPCGMSSVGGRGHPWGGRVHLCASGGGRLWAVVVMCGGLLIIHMWAVVIHGSS